MKDPAIHSDVFFLTVNAIFIMMLSIIKKLSILINRYNLSMVSLWRPPPTVAMKSKNPLGSRTIQTVHTCSTDQQMRPTGSRYKLSTFIHAICRNIRCAINPSTVPTGNSHAAA